VSEALRDPDDVRTWLATNVFHPTDADPEVGKVGLEVELFPFWLARDGRPAARLALVELIGLLDDLPGAARNPAGKDGRPSWTLGGALLTEEPGAQLEVAGPPDADADAALRRIDEVVGALARGLGERNVGLGGAGLDCWSERERLPVQVPLPRYDAMTTYFERRGHRREGHLLMCSSCSLQVNVDLGPPEVAADRWVLANLAAPVITAAFAASPLPGAVNGRAMGWRGLDPTRTGVPPALVAGSHDPLEHAFDDAMRADVLLVARDGGAEAGRPGWRFADWVAEGHDRWGAPTGEDLATHLTTLFPESRLRGFLEVRGVDELPARWRAAPVALLCGLLYDRTASTTALAALEPHRSQVPDLLDAAAATGLADVGLRQLSLEVLEAGLAGARRLGIERADVAERYLERFVEPGRHPSDELRSALEEGPAAAWRWAAEPVTDGGGP
jgi:glutamate--cysteine ligase